MLSDYPSDLESFAAHLAGNWSTFQSFAWHDKPVNARQCGIVITHNRDSSLLEQSNAAAVAAALRASDPDGTYLREHSASHWAVGWVEGWEIRVYDDAGNITPPVKALCDLSNALADYPVLDDEDVSAREHAAALENIGDVGRRYVADDAPEGWAGEVFAWLWDNDQSELEDDGQGNGAYPSDDAVRDALGALGYIAADDDMGASS